jgi:hypothetical protein
MSIGGDLSLQLAQNFSSDVGLGVPPNRGRGRFDPFTSMTADQWLTEEISTVQLGNAALITGLGCVPSDTNRTIVQNGLLFITRGWERIEDEEYREPYQSRDEASAHVFMLHSANAALRTLCAEAEQAFDRNTNNARHAVRPGKTAKKTYSEYDLDCKYVFNPDSTLPARDASAIKCLTAEGVYSQLPYVAPNGAQSNFMASNTADQYSKELSADSNGTMISPVSRGMTPVHNYWACDGAESGQHLWLLLKRSYLGTDEPEEGGEYAHQHDQRYWSAFQYVPYTSPQYERLVEPRVLPYLGYGGRTEFAKPVYVGMLSMTLVQASVTEHMVHLAAGLHTSELSPNNGTLTPSKSHAEATSLNLINLAVNPWPSASYALLFV